MATPSTSPGYRNGSAAADDPWQLVWGQPYIDSERLAAALEDDLRRTPEPDFRTRLLVRDAAQALQSFWGSRKFARWLTASPVGQQVRAILREGLGEIGFPHIRSRLVTGISAIQIKQIFDLLGQRIHDRLEIDVAGSIPTLIQGLTARPTADIDLVNEVPPDIRKQRAVLRKIQADYGLSLDHVQSHYLPAHWQERRQFFGDFGGLRVYLVDPYDIFVSKLSSKQEKHQQDLRVLALKLEPDVARRRLLLDGKAFVEDAILRPQIEANWQFIFQGPLFPDSATDEGKERSAAAPAAKKRKKTRKENGSQQGP